MKAALRRNEEKEKELERNLEDANLDDDAYHDITVDNIQERGEDRSSLSTTMPPSNRGASKVEGKEKAEKDDNEEEEECAVEDDECWNITRNAIFAKRTTRSLATTLPPTNSRKNLKGKKIASSSVQDDDGGNDEFYDISQNMFPENIRRGRSLFRSLATSGIRARRAENNSLPSLTKKNNPR